MDLVTEVNSPPWSSRTKRTIGVLTFAVVAVFAWRLSSIWPPLVISLVLAYLLSPVVGLFCNFIPIGNFNLKRTLATTLSFILALMIVLMTVGILIPAVVAQLEHLAEGLPERLDQIVTSIEDTLSTPISIAGQTYVPMEVLEQTTGEAGLEGVLDLREVDLVGAMRNLLAPLATPVLGFVGSAVSGILNLLFVLTMTFYFMKDGPRFRDGLVRLTPESYQEDMSHLLNRLGQVWNAYLRGQLLLCVIMGFAGFLSATLLGLPSPVILGIINGILEFIPNIGPALALIPATLFALLGPSTTIPELQGPLFAVVIIIVWTALQNLEAIVVVPRIMGDNLDLHPVFVIVAVIGGASLAGALGVVLAAPFLATLRVIGEYLYAKLLDQPPEMTVLLVTPLDESSSTEFVIDQTSTAGIHDNPAVPGAEDRQPDPGRQLRGALRGLLHWLLRITGRGSAGKGSDDSPGSSADGSGEDAG